MGDIYSNLGLSSHMQNVKIWVEQCLSGYIMPVITLIILRGLSYLI